MAFNDKLLKDTLDEGEEPITGAEGTAYRIEQAILENVKVGYENARGQMQPYQTRWRRYWDMYRNEWKASDDSSPFSSVNVALLARTIDVFKAQVMGMVVPDRQLMDWFRFSPEEVATEDDMQQVMAMHGQMAEYAIRNDMIQSHWIDTLDRNVLDALVTGNAWAMPVWEQTEKFMYRMVKNPDYNEALPQSDNVVVDEDGSFIPIEPTIVERVPVMEYDAPVMRYLNPMNVFPSELDVNDISQCERIYIYDTCQMEEMKRKRIFRDSNGRLRGVYANTDKFEEYDEQESVSEVEDSSEALSGYDNTRDHAKNAIGVKKMTRVTAIGRIRLRDVMSAEQIKDVDGEGLDTFIDKFNIDREKLDRWETWILEWTNDRTLVRCQPLPYTKDEKNIVLFRLYYENNLLLGEGVYKRCEYDERTYNFFLRAAIELTARNARPMWGIVRQYVDPLWWQKHEGQITIKPDGVIPLLQGASIDKTFQPLQVNTMPLEYCYRMMQDRFVSIDTTSHVPAIKQGQTSGVTAAEVMKASQSADVFLDDVAQRLEGQFLYRQLEWWYWLRNQYTYKARLVSIYDESGQMQQMSVPPEVWLNMYRINLTGYRQTGNAAVRAMNFKEFASILMSSGNANVPELFKEYAKILNIRDSAKLINPQPPPPGPEPPKESLSVAVPLDKLPAQVAHKVLTWGGVPLDGADLEAMQRKQLLDEQQDMMRALGKARNAGPGELETVAGGGAPEPEPEPMVPPMLGPEMIDGGAGGMPPGFPTMLPAAAIRPPEMRQRGLADEVGAVKSLAQRNRNPANSRRAMQ